MKHSLEVLGLWIVICAVAGVVLALMEYAVERQIRRDVARAKLQHRLMREGVGYNVSFTAGPPPDTTMRIRLGQDEIPRPVAPHLQHRTYMVGRSGLIADTREDTPPDANRQQ